MTSKSLKYTTLTLCLRRLSCYHTIPQTEWLKLQTFISHSSTGWESKIKVPAEPVLGESLFMACRRPILTGPFLSACGGGGRRERDICPPLFTRASIPSRGSHCIETQSLPNGPTSKHYDIRLGLRHMNLWGHDSVYNNPFQATLSPLQPFRNST